MKTAKEIMVPRQRVVTLAPDNTLEEAIEKLARSGVSGTPVVREGKVAGVVSESDILRFVEKAQNRWGEEVASEKVPGTRVREIMTKRVVRVGPDAKLGEVAGVMSTKKVNRVVVVDDQMTLLGLIARGDVVKAALDEL